MCEYEQVSKIWTLFLDTFRVEEYLVSFHFPGSYPVKAFPRKAKTCGFVVYVGRTLVMLQKNMEFNKTECRISLEIRNS